VLLTSLPLYVPVACLLFLLIIGLAIPLCFGRPQTMMVDSWPGRYCIPYLQGFDGRFQPLWHWHFVVPSVLFSLCPALPMVLLSIRRMIQQPLRVLVLSNLFYMSTMVAASAGILRYLISSRIRFDPTGARGETHYTPESRPSTESFLQSVEVIFGVFVGGLLLASLNMGYASLAVCPMLGSLSGSNFRLARVIGVLVLLTIASQLGFGVLLCRGQMGIPLFLSSVHF
jgi:hypothetical protein